MTICWDHDSALDRWRFGPCSCGLDLFGPRRVPAVLFGVCRSGRRWYWAAHGETDAGYPAEDTARSGRADTEHGALAAAREAVAAIAVGQPTIAQGPWRHLAANRLRAENAEKRRQRAPRGETTLPDVDQGHLYYIHDQCWDMCPNVGRDVAPDPNHRCRVVLSWPITRQTAKRIYFRPSLGRYDGYADAFLDRAEIEAKGSVYHRGTRELLYLEAPDLERRRAENLPDLAGLKQQMADAHPDRGGNTAEFIAARSAYQRAKVASDQ